MNALLLSVRGYDWRACLIAIVAGLGAALAAGLLVQRLADISGLTVAVITLVGTLVSQRVYTRIARPGARPLKDDECDRCV